MQGQIHIYLEIGPQLKEVLLKELAIINSLNTTPNVLAGLAKFHNTLTTMIRKIITGVASKK